MKKAVILYASAGSGHKRAAQALLESCRNAGLRDVDMLDILDFTPRLVSEMFSNGYLRMVDKAKWLWRFLYNLSDSNINSFFIRSWVAFLNKNISKKMLAFLDAKKPDIIFSTHFIANDIIQFYKREYENNCRLVSVVTDYVAHRLWVSPAVDLYIVGSDRARLDLISKGAQENSIKVMGIPVPPGFLKTLPKQVARQKNGLADIFTVLILCNGIDNGIVIDTIEVFCKEIQFVVGYGRNLTIRDSLERFVNVTNNLKVYGFIDKMDEIMSAADVIITKPGGLIVSEALTKGIPMILVNPIPGQEDGNREVMVSEGVAIACDTNIEVIKALTLLKSDAAVYNKMLDALRQKHMAGDISGRIVELALSI